MFENRKLSRAEFLTTLGGMMLAAVFLKFSGAKQMVAAIASTRTGTKPTLSTYGNNTYGGAKG
jgi:hypothetical protein